MVRATDLDLLGIGPVMPLARHWWILAIRGLCGIVFGVVAIMWPAITLSWLVLLFAAYLLVDGVFATAAALIAATHHHPWLALLAEGLLGLVGAVAVMAMPAVTIVVMVYIAAFWALLSGGALLAASVRFHSHRWLMALAAIVSLVLGCLLLLAPLQVALVFAMWLGIYALVFGASLLGLSWQLRRLSQGRAPA